MPGACWPNGLRTPPQLSSLWMEYDGVSVDDHYGLDMYGFTHNCAIADGVVIYIGWNTYGGGGREIWYKLDNGDVIVYYHNERGVLVSKGERVVAGQALGVQSDTGQSVGIHLHMEVWRNGLRDSRVDPKPYIEALVGSSLAALGVTPITEEEEEEMKPILVGIHNSNGTKQWALVSPDLQRFVPIWKLDTANDLSRMFGTLVYVVRDEWNGFRTAAGLEPDEKVGRG